MLQLGYVHYGFISHHRLLKLHSIVYKKALKWI